MFAGLAQNLCTLGVVVWYKVKAQWKTNLYWQTYFYTRMSLQMMKCVASKVLLVITFCSNAL